MQQTGRGQTLTSNSFCRPGRDVNIVRSEFTCYCTDKKQWDCHKGATPEKTMPTLSRKNLSPRSMKGMPGYRLNGKNTALL